MPEVGAIETISPIVKYLVSAGALGITSIIFIILFLRKDKECSQLNKEKEELHKQYGGSMSELTTTMLSQHEKQTEVIIRNTSVLDTQRSMLERVLFDVTRSYTPAPVSIDGTGRYRVMEDPPRRKKGDGDDDE
jgi:hypothetical protein